MISFAYAFAAPASALLSNISKNLSFNSASNAAKEETALAVPDTLPKSLSDNKGLDIRFVKVESGVGSPNWS